MYAFYSIGRGLCSWSYGSWIYNYLCNQCLSPLMLWVWILIRARCTTLCDKVCQWLVIGLWFSSGLPVSSTNKTDCHDITEILLKVALNTIKKKLPLDGSENFQSGMFQQICFSSYHFRDVRVPNAQFFIFFNFKFNFNWIFSWWNFLLHFSSRFYLVMPFAGH